MLQKTIWLTATCAVLTLFARVATANFPHDSFYELQSITAPNPAPLEDLGGALDESGGLLIAGAINSKDAVGLDVGSAYVYRRSADNLWNQVAQLRPSDGAHNDSFGYSVGISADFAVVGARTHQNAGAGGGTAYIFHRISDTNWEQVAEFSAPVGALNLGLFADTDASQVAVAGIRFVAPGAGTARAFVDIYGQTGSGTWNKTQEIVIGNQFSFVNNVSLQGNTLVLGTSRKSTATGPSTYQVEVFDKLASAFTPTATISAPIGPQESLFGISASLETNRLLVGAPKEATHGAAYIYERGSNGNWIQQAHLVPADVDQRFSIGSEVALSGNLAIISSSGSPSSLSDGRVTVFQRNDLGNWDEIATLTSSPMDYNFGYEIEAAEGQALVTSGLNAPGTIHVFSQVPEPDTQLLLAVGTLYILSPRPHRRRHCFAIR